MSAASRNRFTAEEYLALERTAEYKSEFFDGEIFAMAGASPQHCRIERNLIARIDDKLRDTGCEVFGGNMKVKVPFTVLYTYPDATIVCGRLEFDDSVQDTLLNPKVIFEVLSETTEAYDRGKKFERYRRIESLCEYVLVSQSEPMIERFARQANGSWILTEFIGPAAILQLETVPCALLLADVYFKVEFAPEQD